MSSMRLGSSMLMWLGSKYCEDEEEDIMGSATATGLIESSISSSPPRDDALMEVPETDARADSKSSGSGFTSGSVALVAALAEAWMALSSAMTWWMSCWVLGPLDTEDTDDGD
jgi:hypothetical protein